MESFPEKLSLPVVAQNCSLPMEASSYLSLLPRQKSGDEEICNRNLKQNRVEIVPNCLSNTFIDLEHDE